MHLRPSRLAVEEFEVLTELGGLVDPCPELVDLVGLVGECQRPGLLEVAVDAVFAGEGDEPPEVVDPFAFEGLELIGEVLDPVRQAVRQARLAETAVAARRAEADRLHLEDRDAEAGIGVGQGDGRPQPGEPGADDRDVDLEPLPGRQRRIGDPGRRGVAQPVRDRPGHAAHRGTLGSGRSGGYAVGRQGAVEGWR